MRVKLSCDHITGLNDMFMLHEFSCSFCSDSVDPEHLASEWLSALSFSSRNFQNNLALYDG